MAYDMPGADRNILRKAFKRRNLTLYLGAGVSVGSGLPVWEKLLLTVYFERVSKIKLGDVRPFPNYLYAISEWYLGKRREPPELVARKLRQLFDPGDEGQKEFVQAIGAGLYGADYGEAGNAQPPEIRDNKTLQAAAKLCCAPTDGGHGVRAVVNYNYDDLLQRALEGKRPAQSVGNTDPINPDDLPIFHVHGFLPFSGVQDSQSMVVLSEQEYNSAASDPYAWPNLVQLREMSVSVGLMVGLSINDRNIRRLLDVLRRSPIRPNIYALMKRPPPIEPGPAEIDLIDERARELMDEYAGAGLKSHRMAKGRVFGGPGIKGEANYQREIRLILAAVDELTQKQELDVLQSLGITPLWYDDHDDIPKMLKEVHHAAQ